MNISSGVDIIEVDRIKNAYDKWGRRFLCRIFTDNEIAYSNKIRPSYQRLATRFATKEAVAKAFGNGRSQPIRWKDIEIVNDRAGRPVVRLFGRAEELKQRMGILDIIVSMSHTKEYAVANAIVIKGKT